MKITTTKLEFVLDFFPATEKFAKKLGKKVCKRKKLEIAEDLINFDLIVGNWEKPKAAIILIDKCPWMIPFEDLELDLSLDDDPNTFSTDLAEANLVWYRYVGKDEELLRAIMKKGSKIETAG